MRLGRLPHDEAAAAAVPLHYGAVFPPQVMTRTFPNFVPGLYGNDWAGDCTAAALANAARGAALVNTGADIPVADAAPLAFFASVLGIPDTREAIEAADGARMLDVLAKADATGFPVGEQTSLVPIWQRVAFTDRMALARAMLIGPVYVGAELVDADMAGALTDAWDAPPGVAGGNIAGGHAFILWDYEGLRDKDTARAGTWGVWKPASWRWLSSRLREAYLLTWPQLLRAA